MSTKNFYLKYFPILKTNLISDNILPWSFPLVELQLNTNPYNPGTPTQLLIFYPCLVWFTNIFWSSSKANIGRCGVVRFRAVRCSSRVGLISGFTVVVELCFVSSIAKLFSFHHWDRFLASDIGSSQLIIAFFSLFVPHFDSR